MKKTAYLISSTLLGLLLSILAHSLIEIQYLKSANPAKVIWHNGCALSIWLQILLPLMFGLGFFFIGRTWWRWVYVKKCHWRFKK